MSKVNFLIIKPEIPHAAFIELAAAQFPAVAADLLDEAWAGLIHLQVGCLTRYANACLAGGDLTEFAQLPRFVEQALPKVASDLDNALYVSFLEDLALVVMPRCNKQQENSCLPSFWNFTWRCIIGPIADLTRQRGSVIF